MGCASSEPLYESTAPANTMPVTVPPGFKPGDSFQVMSPAGTGFMVVVPNGMVEGQVFDAQLPAQSITINVTVPVAQPTMPVAYPMPVAQPQQMPVAQPVALSEVQPVMPMVPRTLEGHSDFVRSVALSSDGTRIVSGSKDKTVRVWDAQSGKCLRTLEGHSHQVKSVALSADGTRIVSGSWDETVRVWDAQ